MVKQTDLDFTSIIFIQLEKFDHGNIREAFLNEESNTHRVYKICCS